MSGVTPVSEDAHDHPSGRLPSVHPPTIGPFTATCQSSLNENIRKRILEFSTKKEYFLETLVNQGLELCCRVHVLRFSWYVEFTILPV